MGTLLESLCKKQGLNQELLAEDLDMSRQAVGTWIRGEVTPRAPTAKALAKRLGYDGDPYDLFAPEQEPEQSTQEQQAMDYLKTLTRQQFLTLVASLPALAGLDFSQLGTGSEPDQFLHQCNAAIDGCYELMKHGSMGAIDSILVQFLPRMSGIASNPSEFQEIAATLAVQAKILQIAIATRKGNFTARELLCLDAVRFGELSGDDLILTKALFWQGDTYVYCKSNPTKARAILEDALGREENSDTAPSKSSILTDISLSYAQEGGKANAQDFAMLARKAMSESSRGQRDLDRSDGRMFLHLAKYFPLEGYAKMAHSAFEQSLLESNEPDHYRSQTLIHKAHACLSLGKLDEYTTSLENGMQIALRIGSQELQNKANIAYGKAENWKGERRYIDLGRLF